MNYLRPNMPRMVYELGKVPIPHNYNKSNMVSLPIRFQYTEEGNVKLLTTLGTNTLFGYYTYESHLLSREHIEYRVLYAQDRFTERVQGPIVGRPPEFILEIGCNDGYLLNYYRNRTDYAKLVGIDPARNLSKQIDKSIDSYPTPVNDALIDLLKTKYNHFDVIHCHNVIGHVPDPLKLLQQVERLMSAESVAVFEFQWLSEMLRECRFYHMYHEHTSYLSIHGFWALCDQAGLDIIQLQWDHAQGGSILCAVGKKGTVGKDWRSPPLQHLMAKEVELFGNPDLFSEFMKRVQKRLEYFAEFVNSQKEVVGLCANAKAVVVLNLALKHGLYRDKIGCIYDSAPTKVGHDLPGMDISIRDTKNIHLDGATCILFAPNLKLELQQRFGIKCKSLDDIFDEADRQ